MVTIYKRGAVYYAQYREGGEQVRKSLKTGNREVAEQMRQRLEVERAQRSLGLVPLGAAAAEAVADHEVVPIEQVRQGYLEFARAHKRPKTVLNDKARLQRFFETVPGMELRQIRTRHVEDYLNGLARSGKSPATLLRSREILHAFWRWAIRRGQATENVVSSIPRPRLPERDPVFLSLGEVDELLDKIQGAVVEGLIATAVFAGLRREELCWLTVRDVELEPRPMLRVRAKQVNGESWQPKTKRDRSVPVSPRLLPYLAGARAAGSVQRTVEPATDWQGEVTFYRAGILP